MVSGTLCPRRMVVQELDHTLRITVLPNSRLGTRQIVSNRLRFPGDPGFDGRLVADLLKSSCDSLLTPAVKVLTQHPLRRSGFQLDSRITSEQPIHDSIVHKRLSRFYAVGHAYCIT